jgi:hypothetical protein
VPPQATHVCVPSSQATPLAVQNPSHGGVPVPTQHASPCPPHGVAMVPHAPLVHVPSAALPLHAVPVAMHAPPTQHPPPVHVCSGQHGCPVPPHMVVEVPLSQMVPVPVDSPDPTHDMLLPFATQHPPAPHMPPVQHASPGLPQLVHMPAVHCPPPVQVVPAATHALVPGSQQSPLVEHIAPAQHVWPVPPHVTHVPAALQARPVPVQVSPAQQG